MNKQAVQNENQLIKPGQDWRIDLFRPEDAAGVTRLFRAVYGADYPIRAYVEPELLIKENAARRIISSVARTASGDIVGHSALFQSTPYKKIYELGAGLVHKDYRGGHGIFTDLIAHSIEIGQRDFGVELVFGESVCNHVFSQKACFGLDLITRALEVDLMPAAAYAKEKSAAGRVSTMLCFRTLKSYPHTVYLPPVYEEELKFLYAGLDDQRRLEIADKPLPPAAGTRFTTEIFDFANVARIAVPELGSDFPEVMRGEEQKGREKGVQVFQVWLNLAAPAIGAAVSILRKNGYFFGGLLPRWFDSDGLLLQKVTDDPDWDKMQIHFDNDKKLAAMIRNDWEKVNQV